MHWILQRYSDNGKSTQGLLFEKMDSLVWFSHSLEDEHRDVKVKKETRIPAGVYELKFREQETELTLKHRIAYNKGEAVPWFKWHIEIVGVKDFSGVYIHSGINESHTDGCVLLMDTMNNNMIDSLDESRSLQAVKRFYQKVGPHLESGQRAFIEIRDEKYLLAA